jgi:osmotically-inducible protein OsmY
MNKIIGSLMLAAALAVLAPLAAARSEAPARAADDSSQPVKDAFLKGRIVSAYALNPHVSVFDLDVTVHDGVAYLGGAVDTPIERDLAVEIARGVRDVREVKADIAVKAGTRKAREAAHRTVGQTFDDAATTAAVKSKLLANPNTGGLGINVTTRNGVVTLSGHVKSEAEKDLAGRLAQNTPDVADVRNDLAVRSRSG